MSSKMRLFWSVGNDALRVLEYIQKHALTTPDRHVAFDLARSIQWLLFDMVCHLCLGHSLGFVDQHEDCFGFQNVLETRLPIVEKFAVCLGALGCRVQLRGDLNRLLLGETGIELPQQLSTDFDVSEIHRVVSAQVKVGL